MHWQETVINRLNLYEKSSKIILDHTGLLINAKFLEYLTDKEIEYLYVENIPQLLEGLKTNTPLFSKPLSLPEYIYSKEQIIEFDLQLLPIEFDPRIAEKLTTEQILLLLDYLVNQKKPIYVKQINYISLLDEAEKYQFDLRLGAVDRDIKELLRQEIDYKIILKLGTLWGEHIFLSYRLNQQINTDLQNEIDITIEPLIIDGITKEAFYAPISSLKTVDKILPFIKSKKFAKNALVCFDGMGIAEWFLLKEYLDELNFSLNPLFALIPTMTKISRTSIFYASTDNGYELSSVNEDKGFKEFFKDKDVIAYREGQIDGPDKLLGADTLKIIYNVFDEIAHKTVLPHLEKNKDLFFENVRNYLKKSTIKKELKILIEAGYKLWFCSDHGSVVATGNGQKIDKYLIETSSKRGTLVKKTELVKFYDVNTMEIPFIQDRLVLLAKNRTSFSPKSITEITHGGITLDEFVVPFVEILN